jgi:transketolase
MPQTDWLDQAHAMASGIRRRVLEHTLRNNGGYLSQACSAAEIFAALYCRIMHLGSVDRPLTPRPFPGVPSAINPGPFNGSLFNGPSSPDSDRFILSPTHYSLVLYAALIEAGRMTENGLDEFNKDGSSVEMIGAEHSPGMEVMTGSLGQGLSQGVGIALGRKLKKASGRVIVFMSDGEYQIGMTWEAIQFMSHYKLDNMIVIIDANRQQCDGTVESVMSIQPLDKRIEAFGGKVCSVDGHDVEALAGSAESTPDGRPIFIIASTDPCRGIGTLRANAPKLHYLRFKSAEEKEMYERLRETQWNSLASKMERG